LRKLAERKSYAVTDHIEAARRRFDETLSGGTMIGSTAPSMFVGRSSYPNVSTGLLAPVGDVSEADSYVAAPRMPGASADAARLTENPHGPRPDEKTLSDVREWGVFRRFFG
jgi:hypothetical protein